jgi:hypothetical protein
MSLQILRIIEAAKAKGRTSTIIAWNEAGGDMDKFREVQRALREAGVKVRPNYAYVTAPSLEVSW